MVATKERAVRGADLIGRERIPRKKARMATDPIILVRGKKEKTSPSSRAEVGTVLMNRRRP